MREARVLCHFVVASICQISSLFTSVLSTSASLEHWPLRKPPIHLARSHALSPPIQSWPRVPHILDRALPIPGLKLQQAHALE